MQSEFGHWRVGLSLVRSLVLASKRVGKHRRMDARQNAAHAALPDWLPRTACCVAVVVARLVVACLVVHRATADDGKAIGAYS